MMKRPTEAQAARIERRIELLRAEGLHRAADNLEADYWDACGLSEDVRKQIEARRAA